MNYFIMKLIMAISSLQPNTLENLARMTISQHPENGNPHFLIPLYFPECEAFNLQHQLTMNLHCTHSRTDLLGSKISSSEVYILEFRAQAKVSCYHYSAKLQLLKWLGFQCHSHVLVQTEPKHHQ